MLPSRLCISVSSLPVDWEKKSRKMVQSSKQCMRDKDMFCQDVEINCRMGLSALTEV